MRKLGTMLFMFLQLIRGGHVPKRAISAYNLLAMIGLVTQKLKKKFRTYSYNTEPPMPNSAGTTNAYFEREITDWGQKDLAVRLGISIQQWSWKC